MKLNRVLVVVGVAGVFGLTAISLAPAQQPASQPERSNLRQPEGRPGEGRPGEGQPGERRGGQRGEAPSVEGSMKGMNRALQQLRDQIGDATKKDACLKLVGDAQRGCIAAKSGQARHIQDIKDEKERAKASESFRRQLMALARKLLDIEQNILDGKGDDAKAKIAEVIKMRDDGHKEFGVDDEH